MGLDGLERPASGLGTPKNYQAAKSKAGKDEAGSETVKESRAAVEAAARAAVHAGVMRIEREMDRKWGRDRLLAMVSAELASKFASARQKYEVSRRSKSLGEVEHRAEVLKRGYGALNAFCEASGVEPLPGNWWAASDSVGNRFIICKEKADVDLVPAEAADGAAVWTLDEIIRVLNFAGVHWTNELKREFGNFTELTRLGAPQSIEMMDDSDPF